MKHERLRDRILSSDSPLVLPFEIAVVGYWIIEGVFRSALGEEQPGDCSPVERPREDELSPYDYSNPHGAFNKQL